MARYWVMLDTAEVTDVLAWDSAEFRLGDQIRAQAVRPKRHRRFRGRGRFGRRGSGCPGGRRPGSGCRAMCRGRVRGGRAARRQDRLQILQRRDELIAGAGILQHREQMLSLGRAQIGLRRRGDSGRRPPGTLRLRGHGKPRRTDQSEECEQNRGNDSTHSLIPDHGP